MKNPFEKTIKHLSLAIKELPNKNNCSDIRKSINNVIKNIENLDKKTNKRNEVKAKLEQEWQEKIDKVKFDLKNPKQTLEAIDKLINIENKKIDSLNATTIID